MIGLSEVFGSGRGECSDGSHVTQDTKSVWGDDIDGFFIDVLLSVLMGSEKCVPAVALGMKVKVTPGIGLACRSASDAVGPVVYYYYRLTNARGTTTTATLLF